jgi:hypothetical protein
MLLFKGVFNKKEKSINFINLFMFVLSILQQLFTNVNMRFNFSKVGIKKFNKKPLLRQLEAVSSINFYEGSS